MTQHTSVLVMDVNNREDLLYRAASERLEKTPRTTHSAYTRLCVGSRGYVVGILAKCKAPGSLSCELVG